MYYHRSSYVAWYRRLIAPIFLFCALLIVLTACGSSNGTMILVNGKPTLAVDQTLSLPLVGASEPTTFDPASTLSASSKVMMNMLYSGLVRLDSNSQVLPDQATWSISADQKVYTFHLKPDIKFADSTSVTAQSYVASWKRAFSLQDHPSQVLPLAFCIAGSQAVNSGKSQILTGVKALDAQTLQVTLTQPRPYFLSLLAHPFFFPVNQKLIAAYGENPWPPSVLAKGVGTGPFLVSQWLPDVKAILTPNPYYYGNKLTLTSLSVYFVNDQRVAYTMNRAGRYDLDWNIDPADLAAASSLKGLFQQVPQLETDVLFFDTTRAPFDSTAVRRAFAEALDKSTYASSVMQKSVVSANTLFPPTMAVYQQHSAIYNAKDALSLLKSVYPNPATMPAVTFTYPDSAVSPTMVNALQSMWHQALGVQINLRSLPDDAYQQEMQAHNIQFGFAAWRSYADDPAEFASHLFSTSPQNAGQWSNPAYDQLLTQANTETGAMRLQLYHQAEQLALNDAAVIPLDHQETSALIPPWVEGVSVNTEGFYFGDWSQVKILNHKS